MKKSKVIIPAMAMILFSTAASISGTVAWFTASRVFTATVANFQVAQLDGNLTARMKAVAGTTNSGTAYDDALSADSPGYYPGVSVPANNKLIDASFNHTAGTSGLIYKLNTDGGDNYFDGSKGAASAATDETWEVASRTVSGTTTNYYIAVAWKIKFFYEFASAETTNIGIYLSNKDSAVTYVNTDRTLTGSNTNSGKGFRIAFLGGGHNLVWGDLANSNATTDGKSSTSADTEHHNNKYTYVNGTAQANIGDYKAATSSLEAANAANQFDFINGETTDLDLAEDGGANNLYRGDRVATITNNGTTNHVEITCVAWFEGTDPNIVNGTAMDALSAKMVFYSRLDAAA